MSQHGWRLSALLVLMTTMVCSPMYLAWRPPVDVKAYTGDGTIVPLPHPLNPGFSVTFDRFALNAPYSATFDLDSLPKPRHNSAYRVGLVIDLPSTAWSRTWPHVPSWLTSGSVGMLSLELIDSSGSSVLKCERQVTQFYWNWLAGEAPLGTIRERDVPECDSSHISSKRDRGEHLEALVVQYRPSAEAPEHYARVQMAAGGFD